MVVTPDSLDQLNPQELRELLLGLMAKVYQQEQTISSGAKELVYRQAKIDQLTHEMAVLKRHQFGRSREQLDGTQASLLEEACNSLSPKVPSRAPDLCLLRRHKAFGND